MKWISGLSLIICWNLPLRTEPCFNKCHSFACLLIKCLQHLRELDRDPMQKKKKSFMITSTRERRKEYEDHLMLLHHVDELWRSGASLSINNHQVGHILWADLWCQSRRTHRGWCRWREGVCPCSSDQYFGWIHYSCWLPFLNFHNKLPVISQKPAYTRSVRQSRHSPLQRALQNFPRRDIGLLSNPTKNFIAIAGPASLLCHRTVSSCQVTTS